MPADDAPDWEQVLSGDPSPPEPNSWTHGIRVDVGVGKSHQARAAIARTMASMRARGDLRTMALAVPMHALGDEQAAAFLVLPDAQQASLRVRIWRGRGAPNPADPAYSDPRIPRDQKPAMCGDLERVQDVQSIGLNAQTAACTKRVKGSDGKRKTVTCPLFRSCAYQQQMQAEADLWIVSHDLLFHEKPDALGELAALVVDEAAWRKGLVGAEGKHVSLTPGVWVPTNAVEAVGLGRDATRLDDLRRQMAELLARAPEGPLSRDAVQHTTLTADSCAEAFKLEYRRVVDPIHPGLSRKERQEAVKAAECNRTAKRMAMAWDGLRVMLSPGAPDLSGWLEKATDDTKAGPTPVLRIKTRGKIAKGWQVPTLLMDALLPPDLVRPFWPDLEVKADVRAEMPHQRIRQVTDKAYSLSMLAPLSGERAETSPAEAKRRSNRLHDLRAILVREARKHAPGRVLVVLQQAVETALHELGRLPPNIETGHHNNLAGRDEWKDAAAVIVVGRTLPGAHGVERIAAAMSGKAIFPGRDWYDRTDGVREMADGSSMPADAERHPDALAESIRWQIAEGELIQIIGRGRGVNRTEANPLDVLVLTDLPLPMPLAEVLTAKDMEPSPADLMLAEGGVVLENPGDAAIVYPRLWPNREAAKKAFIRGKLGTFPLSYVQYGECPQLLRIDYKAKGQGKSDAAGGYDPDLCPEPEEFLTAALGELAWFEAERPRARDR